MGSSEQSKNCDGVHFVGISAVSFTSYWFELSKFLLFTVPDEFSQFGNRFEIIHCLFFSHVFNKWNSIELPAPKSLFHNYVFCSDICNTEGTEAIWPTVLVSAPLTNQILNPLLLFACSFTSCSLLQFSLEWMNYRKHICCIGVHFCIFNNCSSKKKCDLHKYDLHNIIYYFHHHVSKIFWLSDWFDSIYICITVRLLIGQFIVFFPSFIRKVLLIWKAQMDVWYRLKLAKKNTSLSGNWIGKLLECV